MQTENGQIVVTGIKYELFCNNLKTPEEGKHFYPQHCCLVELCGT